jgi:ketosteroid isomerase-like protein
MSRPSVSEDPDGYFRWFYEARVDPADRDGIAERWHEDGVAVQLAALPGTRGTFEGHQGISEMYAELSEASDDFTFVPERVLDLGDDRYLVRLATSMTGRKSGIATTGWVTHLVTMRGERAERIEVWAAWSEALASVGRAE